MTKNKTKKTATLNLFQICQSVGKKLLNSVKQPNIWHKKVNSGSTLYEGNSAASKMFSFSWNKLELSSYYVLPVQQNSSADGNFNYFSHNPLSRHRDSHLLHQVNFCFLAQLMWISMPFSTPDIPDTFEFGKSWLFAPKCCTMCLKSLS